MGTNVSITVYHPQADVANAAIDAALAAVQRAEALLSLYRSDSEVSRLNRDKVLPDASPELREVLALARDLSERSNGAFDITIQPLWEVYAAAKARNTLPEPATLKAALTHVDWRKVHVASDNTVRLEAPLKGITLNGIAQGYAADVISNALAANGINAALIDAGEINALGTKPRQQAWSVGIKHPREREAMAAVATLEGRCLATSGDYETAFSSDFRHNHLLDPQNGLSPTELASVSVVAPTAMLADGLSTAAFLLGPERGRALIAATPGADALFIHKDGQITQTERFPSRA